MKEGVELGKTLGKYLMRGEKARRKVVIKT